MGARWVKMLVDEGIALGVQAHEKKALAAGGSHQGAHEELLAAGLRAIAGVVDAAVPVKKPAVKAGRGRK